MPSAPAGQPARSRGRERGFSSTGTPARREEVTPGRLLRRPGAGHAWSGAVEHQGPAQSGGPSIVRGACWSVGPFPPHRRHASSVKPAGHPEREATVSLLALGSLGNFTSLAVTRTRVGADAHQEPCLIRWAGPTADRHPHPSVYADLLLAPSRTGSQKHRELLRVHRSPVAAARANPAANPPPRPAPQLQPPPTSALLGDGTTSPASLCPKSLCCPAAAGTVTCPKVGAYL